FFQAEDGIRDRNVTGVQTCALPIYTLMNKLGLSSSNGREVISSLLTELTHRESGGRTDILFRQWLALAGVSYGIGDDAEPWPTSRDVMLGDLAGILDRKSVV